MSTRGETRARAVLYPAGHMFIEPVAREIDLAFQAGLDAAPHQAAEAGAKMAAMRAALKRIADGNPRDAREAMNIARRALGLDEA